MLKTAAVSAAIVLTAVASAALAGNSGQDLSQIERGLYLAAAGDCASGQDFAGGLPVETPFGNVVAPNITPDPETGIGCGATTISSAR